MNLLKGKKLSPHKAPQSEILLVTISKRVADENTLRKIFGRYGDLQYVKSISEMEYELAFKESEAAVRARNA